MNFNREQLEKLADLFIDIAKGLFLATLALPIFTPITNLVVSFRMLILGLMFVYMSLKIIEQKGVSL